VLATLYRYMTVGTEPTRERVLLAGVHGDEHVLGLQMVHDQLAAAGFQTVFETDLTGEQLVATVDSQSPGLLVLGAAAPGAGAGESIDAALRELRSGHPELPILLSGPALGGGLPGERQGLLVLERIDETVEAVERVLTPSASAASV
jgi:cobalamin-dependent methionine synthase I